MTRVYLFEITIKCKYGRSMTFFIQNKHDIDLFMELTDYKRLISEGTIPLYYNREVKYEEYEENYLPANILNYDQANQKWNEYFQSYQSLELYTHVFKNLFVKDHHNTYLSFKSMSIDFQKLFTEFYNCCESHYNDLYASVEEYYDDIVENKNDIIERRRIRNLEPHH